jgi:hypothetical protein
MRADENQHDMSGVEATISYLSKSSERPISFPSVAGGAAERNTGGSDERRVWIRDARQAPERPTLDTHGFELVAEPSAVEDLFDRAAVDTIYATEVRDLVLRVTGAAEVVVFDFTMRSDSEPLRQSRLLRDPSMKVHVDHTPRSAKRRLEDTLGPAAEPWLRGRFAIINVWRSARGPVQTTPLAVCDGRTVGEEDLVSVERRAAERIGEIYQVRYASRHRWHYFPDMDESEALLVKVFDSENSAGRARFAPHCAFVNPLAPTAAPPRQSIEARTFVRY